ncbi:MAG: trypsin-like peptidase domain-containing protein [Lachnospiraceae bacterium]|nr:trypsin-like peptidase domain-containing protein [Lachnospiraceae bacterium]
MSLENNDMNENMTSTPVTSTPVQSAPVSQAQPRPAAKSAPKAKKGPNVFVRILLMLLFGIIFGVTSGIAFSSVALVGEGLINPFLKNHLPIFAQANPGEEPEEELNNPGGNAELINTQLTEEEKKIEEVEDIVMEQEDYTVAEVAEMCMPSIVIIKVKVDYNYNGYTTEVDGAGSGIIVGKSDKELLIATNYHVVDGTKKTTIQFCDGTEAEAEVKGKKVNMDLAVVAVDLMDLSNSTLNSIQVATIGNSDDLKVGESVVAIGNALGYGQSVTFGVVSALDRTITTQDGESNAFIQTDAAINPGNSGGALINLRGELIGINSDKLAGSAVEGMGYAIPINAADPIIRDLMNKKQLSELPEDQQSYFGISAVEINTTKYTPEGAVIPKGIYISDVMPGGTADAAGLQRGDIITEFEGDSIVTMAEFKKYLAAYAKGSKVKITYERYNGSTYEEFTVEVTLKGKDE